MALGDAVGVRVQTLRNSKRWTQRQLATELTKLGVALHDTAITRIEKGDRKVTLDELAALARVLDVPPLLLVMPLGTDATVDVLPGQPVPTWAAVKWWIGEQEFPGDEGKDDPSGLLGYYRDHDQLESTVRRNRGQGERDLADSFAERLLDLRKNMRRAGVLPPNLPADLADIEQEGGERG